MGTLDREPLAGDLVRLTRGTTIIQARLRSPVAGGGPVVTEIGGVSDRFMHAYVAAGFAVEILPEPLPTEPGIYIDKEGDAWAVRDNGELRFVATKYGSIRDVNEPFPGVDDMASFYAPFTKVSPAVE